MMAPGEIEGVLSTLARQYPEELVARQLADVQRIAFHISLVLSRKGKGGAICDIGGGVGLFSIGCTAMGMRATLVDDFGDEVNARYGDAPLRLHQAHGVTIIKRDVVNESVCFPAACFDVVTSFDAMEHWHHSPRQLFHTLVESLRDGGLFLLGVPNCVNLRKRITVPLGRGSWSDLQEWYGTPRFRGHVREPDARDLRYIARDLGLTNVTILGRNWLGLRSENRTLRRCTAVADKFLRLFPSICSDLYLLGQKP